MASHASVAKNSDSLPRRQASTDVKRVRPSPAFAAAAPPLRAPATRAQPRGRADRPAPAKTLWARER
eukprot:1062605-Prymnesium_polylepis.1